MNTRTLLLANIIRSWEIYREEKIYHHFPELVLEDFSKFLRCTFPASHISIAKYKIQFLQRKSHKVQLLAG